MRFVVLLLAVAFIPLGDSTPSFKDEKGKKAFEEGKELFGAGDWKAAEKKFKDSQKSTDKDGKKLLKSWVSACKGGVKLKGIEKAVAKEDWRKAWGQLRKVRASYGKTPLSERLDALAGQISAKLFLMLATFEEPPPEPEKNAPRRPATAKLNDDEKFVRQGKRSLRWREKVGFMTGGKWIGWLPIANFGGGVLQDHRYLHISIYSEDKNHGKFTLFFDTGDINFDTPSADILKANCYFHHMTVNHVGWKDFRIDLDKHLQTWSSSMREEMVRLTLLMIPPSKPKTIYIDDIKLERR